MKVRLRLLRWPNHIQETLRHDGWVMSAVERKDELDVSHPHVASERSARVRLYRLGLLTSRSLRIVFCPPGRLGRPT